MVFGPDNAQGKIFISRTDPHELLGTYSRHAIELDDFTWPSVEHYVQAMKFEPGEYANRIRSAPHPAVATRLGEAWFKRKRRDWKQRRLVLMTRAFYTKCRRHDEVAARLLETGNAPLVELSQYDYYWGFGRDGRGRNHYGAVLMEVRQKLRDERLELGRNEGN